MLTQVKERKELEEEEEVSRVRCIHSVDALMSTGSTKSLGSRPAGHPVLDLLLHSVTQATLEAGGVYSRARPCKRLRIKGRQAVKDLKKRTGSSCWLWLDDSLLHKMGK